MGKSYKDCDEKVKEHRKRHIDKHDNIVDEFINGRDHNEAVRKVRTLKRGTKNA